MLVPAPVLELPPPTPLVVVAAPPDLADLVVAVDTKLSWCLEFVCLYSQIVCMY